MMSQSVYKDRLNRSETKKSINEFQLSARDASSPNMQYSRNQSPNKTNGDFVAENEDELISNQEFEPPSEDLDPNEIVINKKIKEAKDEVEQDFQKNDEKVDDLLNPRRKKR